MERAAHAIRGGAANVGAAPFASLCRRVESLSRGGTAEEAAALLPQVEQEFERLRQALRDFLGG